MFRIAQEYGPTILFIDEADSVGAHRDDNNRGGAKTACEQIIQEMNEKELYDKVYVICATNRPSKMLFLKPNQNFLSSKSFQNITLFQNCQKCLI